MDTLPNEYALEDSDTEEELPDELLNPNLNLIVNRWLRLFQLGKLSQKNFWRYWAQEIPQIYTYQSGCNCLQLSFNEKMIQQKLLLPLEQFIWATEDLSSKYEQLRVDEVPPKKCGKIFKCGEPIYTCRDCSVDMTCVRCVDCFKKSPHRNHKFRIGMSGGGGFCDCGDIEAWKQFPFCDNHGETANKDQKKISDFIKILPPDVNNRARIVIRTIVNYCFELLTRDENMSLPEYLEPDCKSNLWGTMLFNDEIHTYEQVNNALLRSIACSQKQAMGFATLIDKEGRALIKCGSFVECKAVCSQMDSLTRRPGPKPLKCHVMEMELVSHQNFVIRLLEWLKEMIGKGRVFAMIFGTEMLRKPPLWKRRKLKSETSGQTEGELEIINSESEYYSNDRSDTQTEVFSSSAYMCTSLLEMVMRTDTQIWKTPRKLWHELFIRGMFFQDTLKREFAKKFTRQYMQLQADFIEDDHEVMFSITDLAIQFYSVPTVALAMIEQEDALYQVISAFVNEFSLHFDQKLQTFRRENAINQRLKRAQLILNDVRRLLSLTPPKNWSKKLTKSFLHGFETFMRLLQQMQDMDSVVRQVGQHVEFEPDWDTGVDLQANIGRTVIKLIDWASSRTSILPKCIRLVLRYLLPKLAKFEINSIALRDRCVSCVAYDVSSSPISVHLPLTRLFCALLMNLKSHQPNYDPKSLRLWLPNSIQQLHPLAALMEHSLRTLVMVAQFRAGIWRRNGYSLVNQVFFYHSPQMRNEMYDRDIQLLQLAAAHIEPNDFMVHLLNRFALLSWFENPRNIPEDVHQLTVTLLEELLGLLLIILSERHTPGISQVTIDDVIKKEIIHRLCINNLSHSDLLRHFNHLTIEIEMEHLIDEVAHFNGQPGQPGGKYELRTEFYEQFSPFFYHYTRQDQCSAEETQLKRKRQMNERFVCCPPALPPEFTAQFRPMLKLFKSEILNSFLQLILELASHTPELWYTETLFEKSMHLVGLGLLEQQRELTKLLDDPTLLTSNSADLHMINYLDKLKEVRIFDHLLKCEPHCKINSYLQLRLWLEDRAQQVAKLKERLEHKINGHEMSGNGAFTSILSDNENANDLGTTPTSGSTSVAEQSTRGRNSELAAQRRARILAQMTAMQNKFIQSNSAYFDQKENSDAEPSGSKMACLSTADTNERMEVDSDDDCDQNRIDDASEPVAIGPEVRGQYIEQEMHLCILCREKQSKEEGECMVMAAFVQRSTVLSKNRSRPAFIAPYNGEVINFCLPSDLHYGVHVSSCGHLMHSKCWSSFFSAILAKERRRPMRFGRQIIYDAEKNEYLCPLCGCLSNSIIPMITPDLYRKLLRSNTSQGVKVSLSDFGEALCSLTRDATSLWIKSTTSTAAESADTKRSSRTHPEYFRCFGPCEFDKIVQGMNEESAQALHKLFNVYQQQTMLDNTLTNDVRELMHTLATRIFSIGVGSAPLEHDDRLPLIIYSTCAFTIQSVERTQRLEGKSMFADLSSRRYNCLQVLVRFVCLSSVLFLQQQLKSCAIRLLQQLLIPGQYKSCSRSCLDLDAFGLLVTLICTLPTVYTSESKNKIKPVMPLGSAFDQNILHIVYMFHIVQIILTDSQAETNELMDVEHPIEECNNLENRSIIQVYCKLLTAAGIKSPLIGVNPVDYKVAERLQLKLKSKLLPFLRCAAVFSHFLSDIKPPSSLFDARPANTDPLCEFSMLCEYVGLPKKLSETFSNRWLVDLAQSWVNHPRLQLLFNHSANVPDAEVPLCIIEQCHQLNRLVDLPQDFCELINDVSDYKCADSDSKDCKMPTMCLICGQILCSRCFCCQYDLEGIKVGSCVNHAQTCGAGVGIFLRIRQSSILLISGKTKGCFIDSPYVDEYGETDMGLNRGNPLQLCSSLYDNLNKLWLEHRIPEKIAHSLEQAPNATNGFWQNY